MPGNYGLWDQKQALTWIQNNIAAFGGNPNRITLWGQSAGSSSTSMLSVSRHTQNLFQQIFHQSGSHLSRWAINDETVNFSLDLGLKLKCENNDKLKKCLKDISIDAIQEAILPNILRYDLEFCNFNPRYDNDFFDTDFEDAIRKTYPKPSLFSFVSHDSAFLSNFF